MSKELKPGVKIYACRESSRGTPVVEVSEIEKVETTRVRLTTRAGLALGCRNLIPLTEIHLTPHAAVQDYLRVVKARIEHARRELKDAEEEATKLELALAESRWTKNIIR